MTANNYFHYLRSFDLYIQEHEELLATDILLYSTLLTLANKYGSFTFYAKRDDILTRCRMRPNTYCEVRKRLSDAGLIDYKPGINPKSKAVFTVLPAPLCNTHVIQTDTQSVTQTVTQTDTQTDTYNNLILNHNPLPNTATQEGEDLDEATANKITAEAFQKAEQDMAGIQQAVTAAKAIIQPTHPDYPAFIKIFNDVAGTSFKGGIDLKIQFTERMSEGWTLDEIKRAIEQGFKLSRKWSNPEYFTPKHIVKEGSIETYLNSSQKKRLPVVDPKKFEDPFAPKP